VIAICTANLTLQYLHFVHIVYFYIPDDSNPYTEAINWSLELKHTVFCEVRPAAPYLVHNNFSLQSVEFKIFGGFKGIWRCPRLLPLREHSAATTIYLFFITTFTLIQSTTQIP